VAAEAPSLFFPLYIAPAALAGKQTQSMMLLPPCLSVSLVFFKSLTSTPLDMLAVVGKLLNLLLMRA